MPALQPPDMQIGGLPPGYGPLPPAGPALAQAYIYTAPKIQQTVGASSTGAAQPTTATVNITASQAGSTIVAIILGMAQGGAQNAPTPTNFTQLANVVVGTTVAASVSVLANSAAGITSVVWPTLTNWSSYVAFVYELVNLPASLVAAFAGAAGNVSATSQTAFATQTLPLGSIVGIGAGCCQTTATIGNGSNPSGWAGTGVQTSTNSQASVVNGTGQGYSIIAPAQGLVGMQPRATASLAAPIVCAGVLLASLASSATGDAPSHSIQVDNGTTAGMGDAGNAGWSLGGTKPGGAGGGQ